MKGEEEEGGLGLWFWGGGAAEERSSGGGRCGALGRPVPVSPRSGGGERDLPWGKIRSPQPPALSLQEHVFEMGPQLGTRSSPAWHWGGPGKCGESPGSCLSEEKGLGQR